MISSRFFKIFSAAQNRSWHSFQVILVISIWLALVSNFALWQTLFALPELQDTRGLLFGFGFAALVVAGLFAFSTLFAWHPKLLRWILFLWLMFAAFGSYFMLSYGIVIDSSMIVNVLQTDVKEAGDLFNWRLLLQVLMIAGLPSLWLWRISIKSYTVYRQLAINFISIALSLLFAVAVLLLIFRDFSSVMRNHTQIRYLINPLNSIYGLVHAASKPFRHENSQILPIGEDAKLGKEYENQSDSPLLILVVGETARAANFALNGYKQPTTPQLSKRLDLINWRNAWSCGTNTAVSLPCMFSHLGKDDFVNRKNNYENLLDVLQRAGLAVFWLDNQSGCKGNCDRILTISSDELKKSFNLTNGSNHVDNNLDNKSNHSLDICQNECLDEIMLNDLKSHFYRLSKESKDRGTVIVMHQMGSHGPAYYKRSPKQLKHFLPECQSNALQKCEQQAVINAYDNSILYTDYFIDKAIDWLQKENPNRSTALMYVSDHGESLGENNIYLHGLPYSFAPDFQKQIPWLIWLSPEMQNRTHIQINCLKKKSPQEQINHDFYFHSVLGLMNIETQVYQRDLDLFASCKN